MRLKLFLFIGIQLFTHQLYSQSCTESMTLSAPTSGTYVAQKLIVLKPGFNTKQFRGYINTGCAVGSDYTRAPNSYIFDIDLVHGGLMIPVKKAFEVWKGNEFLQKEIPIGKLSAYTYWEDVPEMIRSVSMVPGSTSADAKIKVMIDKSKGKGNAVISLHVGANGNQTDEIYWSWHIWVTDDPSKGVAYGHKRDDFPDQEYESNFDRVKFTPQYMDRNLGAVSNHFLGHDWHKSAGLMYEWGRKDPFPPLMKRDFSYYELNGVVGNVRYYTMSNKKIEIRLREFDNIGDNIKQSIKNPLLYLSHAQGDGTWFSKKLHRITPIPYDAYRVVTWDLWGDNRGGKHSAPQSGDKELVKDSYSYKLKSPYDPCPAGWRIPSYYGRSAGNSMVSPWGRKGDGQDDNIVPEYNTILPNKDNPFLRGIKVYPSLGFDFTNVNDPKGIQRNIGKIPIPGNFDTNDNLDGKAVIYQDEFSDGALWSATFGEAEARKFMLVSDVTLYNGIKKNRYGEIYVKHTGSSNEGNAVRCMVDPNVYKIGEFKTEFVNEELQHYKEGIDNPNSYIVSGLSILKIPVNKAFAVNNQYLTNHEMLSSNDLRANVYWTTNTKLIKKIYIERNSDPMKSHMVVELDINQTGNTVVSLHNGSITSPVYWSWHLWAPKDPINTHTYTNLKTISDATNSIVNGTINGFPPLTTTFMDRNLGAVDAFPTISSSAPTVSNSALIEKIKNSGGMHYQWGRKDPIPSFAYPGGLGNYDIYRAVNVDPTTGLITYGNSIKEAEYQVAYTKEYNKYKSTLASDNKYVKARKVLKYATENPLSFLYHAGVIAYNDSQPLNTRHEMRDWISNSIGANSEEKALADDRWGHATKKSPFDPCPKGWRVPDFLRVTLFSGWDNGTSPWFYENGNNGKGLVQQYAVKISEYKGHFVTGSTGNIYGWVFNDPSYPIGNFPMSGTRGELGGAGFSLLKRSGVWSAAMSDYMMGFGVAMNISTDQGGVLRSNTGVFPQAAMNVRCALDEPRYSGKAPLPNSLSKSISTKSIEEIATILDEPDVELYPNPNNGVFTIELGKFVQGNVQVVNMNGNLIYSRDFNNQPKIEIDIQSQPSGVYLIKIISGKEEVKKKVIKK